jgi:hypothetical protein
MENLHRWYTEKSQLQAMGLRAAGCGEGGSEP